MVKIMNTLENVDMKIKELQTKDPKIITADEKKKVKNELSKVIRLQNAYERKYGGDFHP